MRKITETTTEKTFVNKIKNLIPFIEKSTIEKVIFISSTSVYSESDLIPTVTEESVLHPDTEAYRLCRQIQRRRMRERSVQIEGAQGDV